MPYFLNASRSPLPMNHADDATATVADVCLLLLMMMMMMMMMYLR